MDGDRSGSDMDDDVTAPGAAAAWQCSGTGQIDMTSTQANASTAAFQRFSARAGCPAASAWRAPASGSRFVERADIARDEH
jgi:hypothetical protein